MLDEKTFNYILLGLLIVYTFYIVTKNNEPFSDVANKQECSDIAINTQIFNYVLSDLNQTKK
jgi:hypothetical protein